MSFPYRESTHGSSLSPAPTSISLPLELTVCPHISVLTSCNSPLLCPFSSSQQDNHFPGTPCTTPVSTSMFMFPPLGTRHHPPCPLLISISAFSLNLSSHSLSTRWSLSPWNLKSSLERSHSNQHSPVHHDYFYNCLLTLEDCELVSLQNLTHCLNYTGNTHLFI